MATMEKTSRTADQLAKTTRDSYRTVLDHVVALQERNVRFAQGLVDDSIKESRHQVESNRAMTHELLERAENQRDAFQTLIEESVGAYMNLVYTPFAYYRQGLQLVETEVIGDEFPIPNYDELNVEEIKRLKAAPRRARPPPRLPLAARRAQPEFSGLLPPEDFAVSREVFCRGRACPCPCGCGSERAADLPCPYKLFPVARPYQCRVATVRA